ncbi:MAG: lysine 2,3-aminomutase [Planctomycetes bacterium]|nr:lysine 2,3-aminomutase [Planctomycetota bacterium]
MHATQTARPFRVYTQLDIGQMPQLAQIDSDLLLGMKAVSSVLPFRVNNYVVEDLIDWGNIPNDPIFQLTFPQPGMLAADDLERMRNLIAANASRETITQAAREIQLSLNPHPAGQKQLNVPVLDGQPVPGMQHKYRETVLFFPQAGQTCHAYCTYCFRWAQFVGMADMKFACGSPEVLVNYVKRHPEVTSVLFTGGDPLVMSTKVLRQYVEPLIAIPHLLSIRIGTKAPAYWPYRFTTDPDADDLMRLFEQVDKSGKNMAIMAHFSHPRELQTDAARHALARLASANATVRCQAPLIKHVNDDPALWATMWREQIRHNAIPYYMFVERDTGPKEYFKVPLARGYEIFQQAYSKVSGLGRTVRGPSMSCTPGKVVVEGVTTLHGEKVFVLKFLQGRNPEWSGRIFFARYDENASWLDELKPAFGEARFFFEPELDEMARRGHAQVWHTESPSAVAFEEN